MDWGTVHLQQLHSNAINMIQRIIDDTIHLSPYLIFQRLFLPIDGKHVAPKLVPGHKMDHVLGP